MHVLVKQKPNYGYVVIILLLFFNIQNCLAQKSSIKLGSPTTLTVLKKNYAYSCFNADSKRLAWFEYYTSTVFVYDVKRKSIQKIHLKKGRGPGEYIAVTDLGINGKFVYLSDPKNNKIIAVSINTGKKRDIPLRKDKIFRFIFEKGELFLLENIRPKVLISHYNLKTQESYPLNKDKFNILKEFSNPFYRDGYLLSKKGKVLFITKYLPNIYIYDIHQKGFERKVRFDQSQIEEAPAQKLSNGAKAIYPPTKVDIATEDAIHLFQKPNSVFLLSKGATDNRSYNLDKLYEFDLKREKFVNTYDLGTKVDEITSNKNYVFAYSKQKSKIFRYKIITTE